MERDIESNFDAFNDYSLKFDLNINMIGYKYKHSYRVMKLSEDIARKLKLDREDIYLASLIGLLHDIGRYEQWTKYETFEDSEVFDHGDYAVKLLFEDDLIKKFNCNEDEYEIIKEAIRNHNKFKIDESITDERVIKHCKIIRDADKTDILYAFSSSRLLELEETKEEISEKVKECFFNSEETSKEYIINSNDRIVSLLSFVYDINYDESLSIIAENDYYDDIYNSIKDKKRFNIYFETIKLYMEERLKC